MNNPVILLDEVDKLTTGADSNPGAVLLEILDPEQNGAFRDHYLGTAFDLSEALFFCTSNDASLIHGPLLDRMEVIELSGYTLEEKASIAETHLLPKQRRLHGLEDESEAPASCDADLRPAAGVVLRDALGLGREEAVPPRWDPAGRRPLLTLTGGAVTRLIERWTAESGVRALERRLAEVCRWASVRLQGVDLRGTEAAAGTEACGPDAAGCLRVDACHLPFILGAERYAQDLYTCVCIHIYIYICKCI